MKTNEQIRDEVSNSNVRTHRLLLMLWELLEDLDHRFIHLYDESPNAHTTADERWQAHCDEHHED